MSRAVQIRNVTLFYGTSGNPTQSPGLIDRSAISITPKPFLFEARVAERGSHDDHTLRYTFLSREVQSLTGSLSICGECRIRTRTTREGHQAFQEP